MERYFAAALLHCGHHKVRQMLALQRLPNEALQCFASDTAARRPPLQLAQFLPGFAQRYGDPPLLSAQQFLTLHHHQGAVQLSPWARIRAARTPPSFPPTGFIAPRRAAYSRANCEAL